MAARLTGLLFLNCSTTVSLCAVNAAANAWKSSGGCVESQMIVPSTTTISSSSAPPQFRPAASRRCVAQNATS